MHSVRLCPYRISPSNGCGLHGGCFPPHATENQTIPRMTARSKPTVLAVDDEPQIVALYEAMLAPAYEVVTATTLAGARSTIEYPIDVAILERKIAGRLVDPLLDAIHEQNENPVVALISARSPDTSIIDLSVDFYRMKPVGQDELHAILECLLTRRSFDRPWRHYAALVSKKRALDETYRTNTSAYAALCAEIESVETTLTYNDTAIENEVRTVSTTPTIRVQRVR